jgi:fused signal recognition particle receptor
MLAVLTGLATGHGEGAARQAGGTTQDRPLSIPVTREQELAEIAETKRLNREQAEFAARQIAENAAAKKAFEDATAARETTIARQQAEYQAQVAAVEAERVRRERAHAAAMEQWRADVAACEAGETSRCAKPQTP